jgi:hypothetical protein
MVYGANHRAGQLGGRTVPRGHSEWLEGMYHQLTRAPRPNVPL